MWRVEEKEIIGYDKYLTQLANCKCTSMFYYDTTSGNATSSSIFIISESKKKKRETT